PGHRADRTRHGRRPHARARRRLRRFRHQTHRPGPPAGQGRGAGAERPAAMSGLVGAGSMEFRAERLQDLARLAAFLDNACDGIDADARGDVRLATEEVFTNIYAHGYRGEPGPVDIRVSHSPGRITV